RSGQVAVVFQDFRNLDHAPSAILPTDAWVRVASGPDLVFDQETHVGRTFNMEAAPQAGGLFVGDYNAITFSQRTGGFTAAWVSTNCAHPSCTATPSSDGSPSGPDPTTVFTHRGAGGDDQGDDQV